LIGTWKEPSRKVRHSCALVFEPDFSSFHGIYHAGKRSTEEKWTGIKVNSDQASTSSSSSSSAPFKSPIVDICIIHDGESIPPGFDKLALNKGSQDANLNSGTSGDKMYICIARQGSGSKDKEKPAQKYLGPIVDLVVLWPDIDPTPPGYTLISTTP